MPVGRDQTHRVGLLDEERAVQEVPRVFAGDRKLRLRTICFRTSRGSVALKLPVASGSDGKSSRGSVCMRESNRSAATLTPFLFSSIRTSVSGNALMIS